MGCHIYGIDFGLSQPCKVKSGIEFNNMMCKHSLIFTIKFMIFDLGKRLPWLKWMGHEYTLIVIF